MKKIYVLMIAMLIGGIAKGQWVTLNTGITNNSLASINFYNEKIGFAVGTNGYIIKTINSGYSWTQLNSGTNKHLKAVYCADSNNVCIIVENGYFLKSSNGGLTWNSIYPGFNTNLNSIFFTDSNTGFACGDNGVILKTTDSGNTWNFLKTKSDGFFQSIYFINNNTGYAVSLGGKLLKTTDAGNSWTTTYPNNITSGNTFHSVYFKDSLTGYIGAEHGKFLRTNDGGNNWIIEILGNITTSFYSIHFDSRNIGYLIDKGNKILKTTDGGINWSSETLGVNDLFGTIECIDSTCYIAGVIGKIITNNFLIGIKETFITKDLSLSPNPATNSLTLNLAELKNLQNTTVSIYDIQGKILLQQNRLKPQTELDISGLAKGIYIIKVTNEKETMQSKFIKE